MAITITREVLDELRALRLYHWRRAIVHRNGEEYCKSKGYLKDAEGFNRKANRHICAVQTLNSFFDVGDTAEKDDAQTACAEVSLNSEVKPKSNRNYIGQKKD